MGYAQAPRPSRDRQAAKNRQAAQNRLAKARQATQQPGTAQEQEWASDPQALSLSLARKLVESSNTATAVLETDAAHSRLSACDGLSFRLRGR